MPDTVDGDRRLNGIWPVGGVFCDAHFVSLAFHLSPPRQKPYSESDHFNEVNQLGLERAERGVLRDKRPWSSGHLDSYSSTILVELENAALTNIEDFFANESTPDGIYRKGQLSIGIMGGSRRPLWSQVPDCRRRVGSTNHHRKTYEPRSAPTSVTLPIAMVYQAATNKGLSSGQFDA
jgi:hypothetical protein